MLRSNGFVDFDECENVDGKGCNNKPPSYRATFQAVIQVIGVNFSNKIILDCERYHCSMILHVETHAMKWTSLPTWSLHREGLIGCGKKILQIIHDLV